MDAHAHAPAIELTDADTDRRIQSRGLATLPDPIGISLSVFEIQGIGRLHLRGDLLERTRIQDVVQILFVAYSEMRAAMGTDSVFLPHLLAVERLVATFALDPQIVGHRPPDKRLNAGFQSIEPIHDEVSL